MSLRVYIVRSEDACTVFGTHLIFLEVHMSKFRDERYSMVLVDWDNLDKAYYSDEDVPEWARKRITRNTNYSFVAWLDDVARKINKEHRKHWFCRFDNAVYFTEEGYSALVKYVKDRSLVSEQESERMLEDSPFLKKSKKLYNADDIIYNHVHMKKRNG